jgi:hypothetical protein
MTKITITPETTITPELEHEIGPEVAQVWRDLCEDATARTQGIQFVAHEDIPQDVLDAFAISDMKGEVFSLLYEDDPTLSFSEFMLKAATDTSDIFSPNP